MSQTTFFVQRCPTCGRQLQIRVEYLGRELSCEHCQGTFVAAGETHDADESAIIKRADELIATAQRQRK
jgi:DNA-directed RNA polymerase subunit RPC12/RpoP